MNGFQTKMLAAMFAATSLLAVGCNKKPAPVQNADGTTTNPNGSVTVPAQSAPPAAAVTNPDGSVTNPNGSVTYPAGSRVAQRETGQAPAQQPYQPQAQASGSAPLAPAPAPARVTAPAGTSVTVRLNSGLAASRNDVGDRFNGVLEGPVVSHGETIFAAGTPVSGEVVSSKGKGRFKGAGDLGISLTTIGRESVETNVYEKNSPGRGKRTAGFAGGGAGLGALIGGLAGGGKGALIGGLAGAGGGTAAGAYTGNRDVVISAESVVTFRLTRSVTK